MKKFLVILMLALVFLALVAVSFVGSNEMPALPGWPAEGINGIGLRATQAANITATYGAEEYYFQLTAIASPLP